MTARVAYGQGADIVKAANIIIPELPSGGFLDAVPILPAVYRALRKTKWPVYYDGVMHLVSQAQWRKLTDALMKPWGWGLAMRDDVRRLLESALTRQLSASRRLELECRLLEMNQ